MAKSHKDIIPDDKTLRQAALGVLIARDPHKAAKVLAAMGVGPKQFMRIVMNEEKAPPALRDVLNADTKLKNENGDFRSIIAPIAPKEEGRILPAPGAESMSLSPDERAVDTGGAIHAIEGPASDQIYSAGTPPAIPPAIDTSQVTSRKDLGAAYQPQTAQDIPPGVPPPVPAAIDQSAVTTQADMGAAYQPVQAPPVDASQVGTPPPIPPALDQSAVTSADQVPAGYHVAIVPDQPTEQPAPGVPTPIAETGLGAALAAPSEGVSSPPQVPAMSAEPVAPGVPTPIADTPLGAALDTTAAIPSAGLPQNIMSSVADVAPGVPQAIESTPIGAALAAKGIPPESSIQWTPEAAAALGVPDTQGVGIGVPENPANPVPPVQTTDVPPDAAQTSGDVSELLPAPAPQVGQRAFEQADARAQQYTNVDATTGGGGLESQAAAYPPHSSPFAEMDRGNPMVSNAPPSHVPGTPSEESPQTTLIDMIQNWFMGMTGPPPQWVIDWFYGRSNPAPDYLRNLVHFGGDEKKDEPAPGSENKVITVSEPPQPVSPPEPAATLTAGPMRTVSSGKEGGYAPIYTDPATADKLHPPGTIDVLAGYHPSTHVGAALDTSSDVGSDTSGGATGESDLATSLNNMLRGVKAPDAPTMPQIGTPSPPVARAIEGKSIGDLIDMIFGHSKGRGQITLSAALRGS